MRSIVIVGAGQAGCSAAFALRKGGYAGDITLVGEEPTPPYQRPPLSKAYLLGDMTRDRLLLRPEESYAAAGIDLRLETRVAAIDAAQKTIAAAGEALDYDALILTTGAAPIRLPRAVGGALDGVYVVRALADIDAMRSEFAAGRRLLIVGGGYIGLEAAAVAASKGLRVTLVEKSDRILQRVAAAETSAYFRALHRRRGVDIREGVGLTRLTGETRARQAMLSDGSAVDVDFVIIGVGVRPETALAEAAGARVDDGVAVDALGRTSAPGIWAAGDCASFPHGDARLRLESAPHAIAHAEAVAANVLGAAEAYVAKPWFWSDQYDVKLQIAGLNAGYDQVVTRDGQRADSVSFWYYAGARLTAVDAINAPREFMLARRLLDAGKTADPRVIANSDADLRSLL